MRPEDMMLLNSGNMTLFKQDFAKLVNAGYTVQSSGYSNGQWWAIFVTARY